jgi:hypothetical protein
MSDKSSTKGKSKDYYDEEDIDNAVKPEDSASQTGRALSKGGRVREDPRERTDRRGTDLKDYSPEDLEAELKRRHSEQTKGKNRNSEDDGNKQPPATAGKAKVKARGQRLPSEVIAEKLPGRKGVLANFFAGIMYRSLTRNTNRSKNGNSRGASDTGMMLGAACWDC